MVVEKFEGPQEDAGPQQSSIGAVSFFLYEGPLPPGQVLLQDPHLYQPDGMTLPRTGLTVMYGYRGASNVLRRGMRDSVEKDCYLAQVNFRVWIGEWNPYKQDIEHLSTCRFLNLPSRASANLMSDINKRWNTWLAEEGKPAEKFPRAPSLNMHLLDRLVKEDPYDQVNAIAYDVRTTAGVARYMTIFNLEAIDHESVAVVPDGTIKVEFATPD